MKIVPGSKSQFVNLTVTWNLPPKSYRKKNPGQYDEDRYFWQLGGWTPCSRSCAGGTQSQIWYCYDRRLKDIVRRKHCANDPNILTRPCNTFRFFFLTDNIIII